MKPNVKYGFGVIMMCRYRFINYNTVQTSNCPCPLVRDVDSRLHMHGGRGNPCVFLIFLVSLKLFLKLFFIFSNEKGELIRVFLFISMKTKGSLKFISPNPSFSKARRGDPGRVRGKSPR